MSDEQDEIAEDLDDLEHPEDPDDTEAPREPGDEQPSHEPEPTGHLEVDEIISGLSRLDGLEVHEHVAEFENAHQELRRALDAGGQ